MNKVTGDINEQSNQHPVQEDVLRYFIQSASIPLLAMDESGTLRYVNGHMAEVLDVKPAMLENFNVLDATGARDRTVLRTHIDQVIVQKRPSRCEVELLIPNSARQWIRLISHPGKAADNQWLCWSSVENISQVRRLEKTEALYQRSAEIIGRAESLNDFSRQMFELIRILFGVENGYIAILDSRSGMIQFPYFADQKDPWPAARKPSDGLTDYVLTTGRMIWLADAQSETNLSSTGFHIPGAPPVDWIGVPLARSGSVVGVVAIKSYETGRLFTTKDISLMLGVAHLFEVFLNRLELEEAQHRLSSAIEQAAETVMITDTKGVILYVNPSFERSTGFVRSQVIGQTPAIIQSGKHDKNYYREMWSVLNAGNTWRGHFVNRKKDGTLYEEEAVISPVRNKSGEVVNYVAVKRDLTRETLLERQYIDIQKTEVVSRLVESIRHDFGNLLMMIRAQAEDLKDSPELKASSRSEPDRIIAAADQGEKLIRSLANFSGKTPDEQEEIDVNILVQNFEPMARRITGEEYEIQLQLSPRMGSIRVNRVLVEQVLSNLVMNAADAMPQGGVIELRTLLSPVRKKDVRYLSDIVTDGDETYAVIEVVDAGVGVPDGACEKIFEPEFSTKPEDSGHGHGLPSALEIMRKYRGGIGIKENLPSGSIFRLYFPSVMKVAPEPVVFSTPAPELPRGGETVLLAEDDEGARRVIARMLQDQGYNVLEAESGAMAIRNLLSHSGKINLLLSDMMMPDFDGRALYDQISQMQPGIKVIFISGYSRAELESDGVTPIDQSTPMLKKPFRREELVTLVRQVLDAG